ncbi:MAG TPA: hypothetical protein VKR58_10635 [Aquella sp.]|nr:hypothetical protein [Aquella sp.]
MKKRILFICLLVSANYYINAANNNISTVSDCPGVIICHSGDKSKQTLNAYLEDQKAYECYRKFGDTEMSKIAGKAMTQCQTMYGSINPIIRKK